MQNSLALCLLTAFFFASQTSPHRPTSDAAAVHFREVSLCFIEPPLPLPESVDGRWQEPYDGAARGRCGGIYPSA
jgi:hypothetical protein